MKRSTLIASVLLATALGAALVFPRLEAGGDDASRPSLRRAPQVGTVHEYELSYEMKGASRVSELLSRMGAQQSGQTPQQSIEAKFTAQARASVLSATADGSEVAFELSAVSSDVRVDGVSEPGSAQAPGTLLVVARLSPLGVLEELRFDTELDLPLMRQLKAVFSLSQIVFAGDARAAWTASESDPNGRYEASYEAEPVSGGIAIAKTAWSYAASGSGRIEAKGRLAAVFERDGSLVSLEGQRATTYSIQGQVAAEDTTSLCWTRTARSSASPERLAALATAAARGRRVKPSSIERDEAATRRTLEARVAGTTLEDVLAQLAAMPEANAMESQDLYLKLKSFLSLRPDVAATAGVELAKLDARSAGFRVVAAALSNVGSPEAQAALRDATVGSDEARARTLVPYLGTVDAPDAATEALLRTLAERDESPLATSAALSLGAVAHTLRDSAEERSRRIVQDAGRALAAAPSVERQKLYLSVLGNVGTPEQAALVAPYLQSPDPTLRERAISALRFVGDAASEAELTRALLRDGDERVRASAADSLSFAARSDAAVEAYASAIRSERSPRVVRGVLKNLGDEAVRGSQRASEELDWYLANCGNTELCTYAASLRGGLPSAG
jgi:hypothetical protein